VNGVSAALYERQYPIQSALAARDSKRGARFKAEISQSYDVRNINAAKAFVVGDIHEYGIWTN
jgi:hypothetical protein